jgi:hypothetical protein
VLRLELAEYEHRRFAPAGQDAQAIGLQRTPIAARRDSQRVAAAQYTWIVARSYVFHAGGLVARSGTVG